MEDDQNEQNRSRITIQGVKNPLKRYYHPRK
jgi:hypothetical protein